MMKKVKFKKTHKNKKTVDRHKQKKNMPETDYIYPSVPHHPYAAKYIPPSCRDAMNLAPRASIDVLVDFIKHTVCKLSRMEFTNVNDVFDAVYFLSSSEYIHYQQMLIDIIRDYGPYNSTETFACYIEHLSEWVDAVYDIANKRMLIWDNDWNYSKYLDDTPFYLKSDEFANLVSVILDMCIQLKEKFNDREHKYSDYDRQLLNTLMDPFSFKYFTTDQYTNLLKICSGKVGSFNIWHIDYLRNKIIEIYNTVNTYRGD